MNKLKLLMGTIMLGFVFSTVSFANETYVLKNGESIQNVLNTCHDTADNHVTIYLEDGEYSPFSMIKPVSRERYVDICGINAGKVKVVSHSGRYTEPAAEIRTNGTISNIIFINRIDKSKYSIEDIKNSGERAGYAVHADYGKMNVKFLNCKMVSGQNVALGMGLSKDSEVDIENCELINDTKSNPFGDGYYKLGSFYCHTDVHDVNQHTGVLKVKNTKFKRPDNAYGNYTIQSLFGSTVNFVEE